MRGTTRNPLCGRLRDTLMREHSKAKLRPVGGFGLIRVIIIAPAWRRKCLIAIIVGRGGGFDAAVGSGARVITGILRGNQPVTTLLGMDYSSTIKLTAMVSDCVLVNRNENTPPPLILISSWRGK